MVRRRKSRRMVGRGRVRKRKRRGPKVTKLLKNKTTAHLRYVDTITIDPGAASILAHTYSANGLYDPDISGTGHQPLMYDEYTNLYGQYRVISSKIKVTPVLSGTSTVVPGLYGVLLEADGVLDYSLATSIIEDQRIKGSWGTFGTTVSMSTAQRTSTKMATFKSKSFFGPRNAGNPVNTNVNPSDDGQLAFYQLWVGSLAGNNPGAISFIVQLDYIVEFTKPLEITPS